MVRTRVQVVVEIMVYLYVRTYVHVYVHVYHGTSASVKLRVLQPQDGADQRRGDIKVSKHGNTWILDVGVVCPGTQRYVDQGSGTTPGLAAEAYAAARAPRSQRRSTPTKTTSFRLSWRQVVASTKRPVTGSTL
jgi:hypothetical protein